MKKTKNKLILAIIIAIVIITGIIYFATKTTPIPTSSEASNIQADIPGTYYVEIKNSTFDPNSLTISKDSIVIWTNKDYSLHTVTSNSGTAISSRGLGHGESYQQMFKNTGTYNYHCSVNTSIKGIIIVK